MARVSDTPAVHGDRVPKMWLACAKHPNAGSCWVSKDGHTYGWCYECKAAFAVEREEKVQPDYHAVREHLQAALEEMGEEDND